MEIRHKSIKYKVKRTKNSSVTLKEKAHQAFLNFRKFINPSNQGIILTNVDQSCSKLRKVAQSLSKYTLPIQTTKSTQKEMKTI